MKKFIALTTLVFCAQALPSQSGNQDEIIKADLFSRSEASFGFASVGNGTHGGAGGAAWIAWDALTLQHAITSDTPRIIYINGRIDLTELFIGSPGVVLDVGSWKTIIGAGSNAEITGGGLRINRAQQVIIRNIKFSNALSYAPGELPDGKGGIVNQHDGGFTEVDSILCQESEYVWIDHNEFDDYPWISNDIPNDRMRHDGHVDIKRASNWVTLSNNIFRNHNKNMLIGHSDKNAEQDVGKLKTSLIFNWFMGTKQRNPRVRYGEVHILNNLYTDLGTYGIGVAAGASIYAEKNVFIRSRAWRHPDGVSSPIGNLVDVGNQLINGSSFNAVPADVRWTPNDYYHFDSLDIADVEAHVRSNAGTW